MWIGTGKSEFMAVQKERWPFVFQEHLTCFFNVKGITLLTLKLVNQGGGFAVSKGGDRI